MALTGKFMSKKNPASSVLGPKAMEMVMRDVLSGMEDLATMKSFESINNVFEIVSITPVEKADDLDVIINKNDTSADIIPFQNKIKS